PSRIVKIQRFTQLWSASGNWGLVVLPSNRAGASTTPSTPDSPGVSDPGESTSRDPCEQPVARAVEEVRSRGLVHADDLLEELGAHCSDSPAFMRELAGLRFAQKRWRESETLAQAVITRVPQDEYSIDLLGAARFMQGNPVSALRAWNAIQKPRLDLVHISGLTRSRY